MSKAVMISIKPKYCELIAAGIKKIEVRKTKLSIPTPFKVYIYQTKTVYVSKNKDNEFLKPILDNRLGKVIGEYVCDEIVEFTVDEYSDHIYYISDVQLAETCLSQEELWNYGKGKTLYGYHISNLVIYDKPKELSEFKTVDKEFLKNVLIVQEYITIRFTQTEHFLRVVMYVLLMENLIFAEGDVKVLQNH